MSMNKCYFLITPKIGTTFIEQLSYYLFAISLHHFSLNFRNSKSRETSNCQTPKPRDAFKIYLYLHPIQFFLFNKLFKLNSIKT